MKIEALLLGLVLVIACNPEKPEDAVLLEQVRSSEQSFNDLAQNEGIGKAFLAFADDNAVLVRNNKVIRGKKEITRYFASQPTEGVSLSWKPNFIEVSQAGDLAYTYGQYHFTYLDLLGTERTNTGIFHTVWKRQADGSWKFVYD